jgi:hypothetical protein
MKSKIQRTVFHITVMAAAIAMPGMAQSRTGTLTEFDAPGAGTAAVQACGSFCGTIPLGNNDSGDIVGWYTDANIVPHGFLRHSDGTFVSFDAPGAGLGAGFNQGTVAYAINNLGVIAGQFQDSNNLFHAFIRGLDGSFTVFDVPGAGAGANQGSVGLDINMGGTAAGAYIDRNNLWHAFVRTPDGNITPFDAPGAVQTFACEDISSYAYLRCMNSAGAIVGYFLDSSQTVHGFIRDPDGNMTVIDATGAATGNDLGTYVSSINDRGAITGYVLDANNVAHSFMRTREGEFTEFDLAEADPNGPGTSAFSIDSRGVISGVFWDAKNIMHGFERWPRGAVAIFEAPHAGSVPGARTGPYQGTRPDSNNAAGQVTGRYRDAGRVLHGFVWQPDSRGSQGTASQ